MDVSSSRPPSGIGRTGTPVRKHYHGYRTTNPTGSSYTDELLFKSFNTALNTSVCDVDVEDPPWVTDAEKKLRRKQPLLWAPTSSSSISPRPNSSFSQRSGVTSANSPRRNAYKYRLTKHTDSFVDESLFGPPVQEASFTAPWNEKKKAPKPLLWDRNSVNYDVGNQNTSALNKNLNNNNCNRFSELCPTSSISRNQESRNDGCFSSRPFSARQRCESRLSSVSPAVRPIWKP